jgi:hypothetical protein
MRYGVTKPSDCCGRAPTTESDRASDRDGEYSIAVSASCGHASAQLVVLRSATAGFDTIPIVQ